MKAAIALTVLASPIIAALLVHIFRDVRGRSRNARGTCYSCGESLAIDGMRILHHHKGGTYLYCQRCGNRHELWKGIALSIMAFIGAATLGIVSVSSFERNPQQALLLAGIALLIVVFIVFLAIRYITTKI